MAKDGIKYRKLYGRICELYGTQKAFAQHIELSEVSVSAKLRGRSEFSRSDIIQWCDALKIPANEVGDYFFNDELSKYESQVVV